MYAAAAAVLSQKAASDAVWQCQAPSRQHLAHYGSALSAGPKSHRDHGDGVASRPTRTAGISINHVLKTQIYQGTAVSTASSSYWSS